MTTTVSTDPASAASTNGRAQAMLDSRHTDTTRRRQRVITALERARAEGTQTSVSCIARAAAVDRSFLYRHHDLLESLHALAGEPTAAAQARPAVTRASLEADLLAAHERAARLNARVQHLEKRLSEASATKPGASPASAPQLTSTPSTSRPPASNNRSSTCACSSTNATRTSLPPVPPTESS